MKGFFSEPRRQTVAFIAVAVGFMLALGFVVYDKLIAPEGSLVSPVEASQASIAILPFTDLSSAGDQEYFAQGIAAEIHKALVKIPNLKVAGRSSSFHLRNQNVNLGQIGEALGVNYILEGSFSSKGGQAQITVTLVNASNGDPVWLATFDRKLTDIFAIQREITNRIRIELLGPQLTGNSPDQMTVGTLNLEAYNLYLRANFVRGSRTKENMMQAESLLKQAVVFDPDFANAWGALAKVSIIMQVYGYISQEAGTQGVLNAAEKALALDPNNSEALASLGMLKEVVDLDFAGVRSFLERAIKSNPNDIEAQHWYNLYLIKVGKIKEGFEGYKTNYERDPFYYITTLNYLGVALALGKIEEVERVLATVAEGQLGNIFEGYRAYIHFMIALMEDNIPEAKIQLAKWENLSGRKPHDYYFKITGSEVDQKLSIARAYEGYQAGQLNDLYMIEFFSFLKDYEAARPYARRIAENYTQAFLGTLMYGSHPEMDPRFRKIRPDFSPLLPYMPEYVEGLKRAGIDIYEVLQIERPVGE